MKPLVVVGGGISGLSTAYYLSKLSKLNNKTIGKIILIESSNRLGGWVNTVRNEKNGAFHELGPRSLRKAGASGENTLRLISELGIEDDVLIKSSKDPNVGNRYIATSSELARLPKGFLSLVFRQKPFSKPFYKYLLHEIMTPRLDLSNQSLEFLNEQEKAAIGRNEALLDEQLEDTSIHNFMKLRFGNEVADYMFDPLMRGITSGDARKLSVRSMFEDIFKSEREFSSILKGVISKSKKETKNEGQTGELSAKLKQIASGCIYSFKNGMVQLPNALIDHLSNDSNVELKTNSSLKSFKINEDGGLSLTIESDEKPNYEINADQVFFGLNAIDLTKLIPEQNEQLQKIRSTLESIRSASVATINLEINKKDLLKKYPGFGFLIPSHVNSSILGVIFDSLVFPELNSSDEITRLSVMGGGDWFEELCKSNGQLDDSKLMGKSAEVLYKYLGINDDPSFIKINVLENCIPQYHVGHYLKLKLLDKEIKDQKLRLSLIGSSYSGVSLNDCIYNSKNKVDSYLNKI